MTMKICVDRSDRVLSFAAVELKSHLDRVSDSDCAFVADLASADFVLSVNEPASKRDDAFTIREADGQVVLRGSNARSVLFAVYRYLRELGFRWIRPGEDSEIVPDVANPIIPGVDISEEASYAYRTICIEGACSLEHVRDMIDWGTKHFMSGYFIQFDFATCFWERWYKSDSPYAEPNPDFSIDDAKKILAELVPEMEKRGLLLERMGHDWTCRTIGLSGEGWTQKKVDLTPEQQQALAQVNGKRELWGDIAMNTNLCYSSDAVRQKMVNEIVDYARKHPSVDLLHFWLADGVNNHCECDNCRDTRPADFYVQVLNELDRALAADNLSTRIVFLIYVDLLWPPLKNKLENPDRFVLMFAPITRSYLESFDQVVIPDSPLPAYTRNKLEFPKNVGVNLQFLQEWQKMFNGDCFDFDYHMLWTINNDLSSVNLAKVLHRDIRHLVELGMQGMNSCQIQRISFPHNLMMDVLTATLWNRDQDFEQIFQESMQNVFGQDATQAGDFFAKVSDLWLPFYDPVYIPEKDDERIAESLQNIVKIDALAREMVPLVSRDRAAEPKPVRESWRYLGYYLELLQLLLPAYEAYLKGDKEDCKALFEKTIDWLWKQEPQLHRVLDVFELMSVLKWRINELLDNKSGII